MQRFINKQVLYILGEKPMSKKSKFEKGMKVKSVLNKFEEFEVVEVLKNELRVRPLSNLGRDLEFTCKKSIFDEVTNN